MMSKFLLLLAACAVSAFAAAINDITSKVPPPQTKTCKAVGDPHYTTYDGKLIHYHGYCTYLLTGICCEPCAFQVLVDTKECPPWYGRACVNSVIIKYGLYTITIPRKEPGSWGWPQCKHDIFGVVSCASLGAATGVFVSQGPTTLAASSRMTYVTHDGISVEFNGRYNVKATIEEKYFDVMCGICGDADGSAANDWTGDHGKDYSGLSEPQRTKQFGDSWQRGECCTENEPDLSYYVSEAELPRLVRAKTRQGEKCAVLNGDGFLDECIKEVGDAIQDHKINCALDTHQAEQTNGRCATLEALIADCPRAAGGLKGWAVKYGCGEYTRPDVIETAPVDPVPVGQAV